VALNSTLSVAEIVQLAADRARSILEVHQAAVNLNAIGNWERGISKFSLSEKYAKWRDYSEAPDGTGIYREIAQQQLPMRMTQAELEAHPAWRGFGKSADKHPPMRGWLAVPLTARNGKNLGIIQLSDKYDESEFGEDNVISIVDEALNTVRLAADAKSIDLRLTIVPQESESSEFGSFTEVSGNSNSALNPRFLVLGDANRLQQVIWNLLTNAVKFTPHGGRVEIRLREVDSSVELAVTDTGIGIAADFLPYVFESFRQADATITRNYSGLGLGLAIVRQLVELHGGTVWAESGGLDMGATFTFRLPACSPNSIASEEPGMPAGGANLEGIQVLVVDDEVDSLEFLAFVLSDYGAQVRAAASAAEAFQAASEFLPDVLVSDIGMPEEDGYSLLARLRSLAGGGKFGAIALTAYARDEDRERALAAGFDRHLAKPVEAEALLEAIVKLVIGNW
jgi:CheY-like chemotaxis protein